MEGEGGLQKVEPGRIIESSVHGKHHVLWSQGAIELLTWC